MRIVRRKRSDSFKISSELFKRGRYLTPSVKWLYVTLKSFSHNRTQETFPSYQAIMEKSGLTRNAVAKGLAELEKFKWIFRQRKRGSSNNYILCIPSLKDTFGKEVEDSIHPTKEMAVAWAKSRRPKKKMKVRSNNYLGSFVTIQVVKASGFPFKARSRALSRLLPCFLAED